MGFLIEVEKRKRRFFLYFRVSFFVDEMKLSFALLASLSMAGRIKEKSKLEELEEKYKEDPLVKDIDRENDPQDYDHAAFAGEDEYKTFDDLSPEEAKEKLGLLIDKMDKDGDGKVTEEERKQFHDFRDKDQSGFLENEEVRDWILPSEYDHAEGEARHLIESADSDNDGILTKHEILENHDVFVGSQATDWGDAIVRHDEF